MECDYENDVLIEVFETLSHKNDENLIVHGKKGATGFPLIDAV